ncbi:MAG: hypothetical protein ACREPM_08245 [Gemmatimonadaceae bacterium]
MAIEVWLVFPQERRSATLAARNVVERESRLRGWSLQQRSTAVIKERSGRSTRVLSISDANALYRQMHRKRVAVLAFQSPQVCLRQDIDAAVARGETIGLARFCRYKSFFVSLNLETGNPMAWMAPFAAWCDTTNCDDEYDPRCLPFHVFSAQNVALDTEAERQQFDASYGHGRSRCDDHDLTWKLDPRAFHGHETLSVAGRELPQGYHWDVNAGRRPVRIGNGVSEWLVKRYVNVHPDATILGRAPFAKKVP